MDRVGPHFRQACRRALRSGDVDRMRLAAKAVIGELTRRGELLGVSIAGGQDSYAGQGSFYMVKGSRRLLDLSFLGTESIGLAGPAAVPSPAPAPPLRPAVGQLPFGPDMEVFSGMLGAMEHAQDLEIGDPQSGEKVIILASIFRLLERLMPQFPMFIMLHGNDPVPGDQDQLFTIGPDEAAGGWLSVRTPGHSVWIPDPAELPGHIRKLDGARRNDSGLENRPLHSAVAVPLWEPGVSGEPPSSAQESGLFFLIADGDLSRDSLLRLAERLSRFVTRRWRHQREVNQRIHVDGLTGVYNRAFFDSQFTLELERARRSEVPLTLIIADLDKFKGINDTYGHQAGDATLRMVARRLQEELRRIDHICRIGGEEFALILPDTSLEAAQEVMGRLLDSKFHTEVSAAGDNVDITVTFSYGAVTFPAAGADPFELYRKADAMLFISKDLGRNRCHFWSSDGDHLQLLPSDTDV